MNLFAREPETLDGFTPAFTRAEVRMGYKSETRQAFRGFGPCDDDDEVKYVTEYSITICGHRITSSDANLEYKTEPEIIATMVNDFIAYQGNKRYHPEAWDFLAENAAELNRSRIYWEAMDHRNEIDRQRRVAADMLEQCRRAEWVSSLYALQAKEGRRFSLEEKNLLLAEFSGGEYFENRN